MQYIKPALVLLFAGVLLGCASFPDAVVAEFTPPSANQTNHFSIKLAVTPQPSASSNSAAKRP